MAVVTHRYHGKVQPEEEKRRIKEKAKLDSEFVIAKKRQVDVRRIQSEMLLAKARGELIERNLVERQAAFLLVALRQKILSMPLNYSQRLLNIGDAKVMNRMLGEMAISVLNDLMDLPSKVINPDWLKELEADEGK
jgi:hypothetical protein